MAGTSWGALAQKAAEAPGGGSFEPLPPGKYQVKVEAAEARQTQTNKLMFVLTLVVTAGTHAGRKVWTNMVLSPENATALSIFFRQMAAIGADANFFATEPDEPTICARIIDKTAVAVVAYRKDDPTRNDVKDLQPDTSDPLASGGGTAAPSAPPADPFA